MSGWRSYYKASIFDSLDDAPAIVEGHELAFKAFAGRFAEMRGPVHGKPERHGGHGQYLLTSIVFVREGQ